MDQELSDLFYYYREAKAKAERANTQLMVAEADLLKGLEARRQKTITLASEGRQFTATYTQRSTTQIDEKGLRKALTARVFDKYTVKKLDRKALEGAMERGEVDPRTVAQYVAQQPGKTFLTYRVKDVDESEDR